MRIKSIATACAALALLLLPLSKSAMGQQFLPAGPITDTTQSLGQFTIVVNPAFVPYVSGSNTPAGFTFNSATSELTSPLLYDPSTQIDRSATTTVGSAAYNAGLTVGNGGANGTVSASSISVLPTGYTPTAGEDTVFTQIHTFDLSNGGGTSVTAGAAAAGQPASVGEVVSNATGANIGNPANDFPATSFFDIFVDVNVPGLGSPLTNSTPLVIQNPAITSFPPVVIYTHGNSSAVPLMLTAGNNFGPGTAGDIFGVITLAGHGAGYSDSASGGGSTSGNSGGDDENTGQPANSTTFQDTYNHDLTMPSDLMPLPNTVVTTNLPGGGTTSSDEDSWANGNSAVPALPEPTSLTLLAVGVVAMARRNRRVQVA